ncbi:MAG: response regulator transcription factor [Opitutaceae bacterium]|jgi:DNA-binding NarL/FixJ family response regulator
MPKSPLRCIIVHSQRLVAELLEGWLMRQYPECCVSRYATLSAALGHRREELADICIFDARNARDDWDEFADEAFYKEIAHKLLILAEDDDDCLLAKLRHAKIDGIVDLNGNGACEMFEAMRMLLGGGTYISPHYKQAIFSTTARKRSVLSRLTHTETLILASIGAGFDQHDIAEEMNIALGTVHSHRISIMRKLEVSREGSLVVCAFRLGLVKASSHGVHRPGFEVARSARDRLRRKTSVVGKKNY